LPTTTLEGESKKSYSVKIDIHLRTLPPGDTSHLATRPLRSNNPSRKWERQHVQ